MNGGKSIIGFPPILYQGVGNMKKFITVFTVTLVVLLFAAISFTGCSKEPPVFRIVMESPSNGAVVATEHHYLSSERFDELVHIAIEQFNTAHEDVKFEIEWLPKKDEAREIRLEQLRVEIMAGKGPDIFILPTTVQYFRENLILDVEQAMRNGLFADLSEYYDADDKLGKESLVSEVMDAGVVDGYRYVLPLRYNLPVAYVNEAQFEAKGLSVDLFSSGMINLMDAITATGNPDIVTRATNGRFGLYSFNYLSKVVDYDNGQVLISKEELVSFLRSYPLYRTSQRGGDTYYADSLILNDYLYSNSDWVSAGFPLFISDLDELLNHAAIAKLEKREIGMYPICATDGSVVADVTMYTAVSRSCENPALAYEFVRLLLLEDFQWEQYELENDGNFALTAIGWPVRVKGSVKPLYQCIKNSHLQSGLDNSSRPRGLELNDDSVPVLGVTIDRVLFPNTMEYDLWMTLAQDLVDWQTGAPKDANLDQIADAFIKEWTWYLAEG